MLLKTLISYVCNLNYFSHIFSKKPFVVNKRCMFISDEFVTVLLFSKSFDIADRVMSELFENSHTG